MKHSKAIVDLSALTGPAPNLDARPVNSHFWWAAPLAIGAAVFGADLSHIWINMAAIALIVAGGLPHGAHDLALVQQLVRLSSTRLVAFAFAYLGTAGAMALLWWLSPLAALALFLLSSTLHFADDWPSLPDPLLRVCAGASVICAATIGHPLLVETIFAAMAGPQSIWLARIAVAVAPVVLLVTAIAIGIAIRDGQRARPLAMALGLVALVVTPPLVGFALYFTLVHAPWHMLAVRRTLRNHRASMLISAPAMTVLALLLWGLAAPFVAPTIMLIGDASLFMLLSVVALPHLLCSHWLERPAPVQA